MAQGFIRTAILSGILVAFAPGIALGGDPIPQKGTTPYVTHFIFRPLVSLDVPGFKATALRGACDVNQVPNITRRSVDALHTLRPPQFLTSRQSLCNQGRDSACGEGRHFDWWCQSRHRARAGAAPLGVARFP